MILPHLGYDSVIEYAPAQVVPGIGGSEGAWQSMGAALPHDNWMLEVLAAGFGNVAGDDNNCLIDIGVDLAGGTTYVELIYDLLKFGGVANTGGEKHQFPLYIPAGATLAYRGRSSRGTAGGCIVRARAWGNPKRPELTPLGHHYERIGTAPTLAGCAGDAFTPGASGTPGTWVSLGTTTKDLWWWNFTVTCGDTTMTDTRGYTFDFAFGDATNKHMLFEHLPAGLVSTNEDMRSPFQRHCMWPLPAGSELFVRGTCNSTSDSGFSALAHGIGG